MQVVENEVGAEVGLAGGIQLMQRRDQKADAKGTREEIQQMQRKPKAGARGAKKLQNISTLS